MSGPTEPHKHPPKRQGLAHHVRQPHGLIIIGILIFFAAWLGWTFFFASPPSVDLPH